MSASSLYRTISNVGGLVRDLEASGLRIVIGDDFSEYRVYRKSQRDRDFIFPMFDVANSYVDETNGFWICGFNQSDELIHTQAVRLIDLSGTTLEHHLNVHRHKYITPDSTPDPDLTFYSGPEALRAIKGRVCYHGEFWLHARGLGGPRSLGITPLLSRMLFEMAIALWKPDFVFAFIPKQLAAKGAHLRYGYSHCEPGKWIGPDQQVTDEDFLVWMNASDLSNTVARETPSLQPDERFAPVAPTLALNQARA